MACPSFLPTAPMKGACPAAAPLGGIHDGECAAGASPTAELLQNACNYGYGRTECPQAAEAVADARRFILLADSAAGLEIAWSEERDHSPHDTGTILYEASLGQSPDPLEGQAAAYAACYLRQKGGPRHL